MILINSAFLQSIGIVSDDGNIGGDQYDFHNYLVMSNSVTVYDQYEFFRNSPVDGIYYEDQYEWYKAIGVFHSEPIYDQYSFFQNVTFDGVNPVGNQYDYYQQVSSFVGIFTISHSFLLDGVNEIFTILNADLSTFIFGTGKQFTLNFVIKRDGGLATDSFFGIIGGAFFCRVTNGSGLDLFVTNGAFKSMKTISSFDSKSIFYCISIVYDGVTPANSKIFVNSVDEPLASNTLTNTIDANVNDFTIGQRNTGIPANIYQNQFSLIDKAISLTEHQDWYNSGKPLNPQTYFGTDCKIFFNPDNSGSVSQFTVTDSINSKTIISSNMEDSDKTTNTPY